MFTTLAVGVVSGSLYLRWCGKNGVLVCSVTNCIDKAIIGSRDINVARAAAVYRHELEPDRKLTNPTDRRADQNDILY